MPLTVQINTSFIVPLLKYLSNPSESLLREITNHDAARLTYAHAVRFGNTKKDIKGFWIAILKKLAERDDLTGLVKNSMTYLHNESDTFSDLLKDLWNYFPDGTDQRTNLYGILGYDVGIISEGNALLNLGHPDFNMDPREILFMAMHELHHVVYTAYNTIFSIDNLHTISQLLDVIKYCTHMEGLAVYCTLERRKAAGALNNRDYQLFLDEKARKKRVSKFFDILTDLEIRDSNPINEKDLKILDMMADKDRLWYVTGAHMAESIDSSLGRETLNETIRLGPDDFFKKYHDSF
jgi:hypothetical protein